MTTSRLGEFAVAHYGKALKAAEREGHGAHPVFGSSGIVGRHDKALVSHPTIIVGRKGSVGLVTYAPEGGWPIDTAYYLELSDPERVDLRYLYWALSRAGLDKRAITTSIPGLNRDELYRTRVRLPSFAEQRRIAAVLDKADGIRRKRRESIKLLDEFLRSAFLEMFGDPVRNEKGWEVRPLGELAVVRRGASPRPIGGYLGGTIPWIKIGDATESTGLYIERTAERVTEAGAAKSVRLEAGSIIVANSGVSLGFARILSIGGCIHDGWLSVEQLQDSVHKFYFVSFVNQMTDRLRAGAPTGTQPNLNIGILRQLRVPLPPDVLQARFDELVKKCLKAADCLRAASRTADGLFDSLARRAFGGEL